MCRRCDGGTGAIRSGPVAPSDAQARDLVGNHSSPPADRYLRGLRGIEIGGSAHNDFLLDTAPLVRVDAGHVPGGLGFAVLIDVSR